MRNRLRKKINLRQSRYITIVNKIMNVRKGIMERIVPGEVSPECYLWHIGRYVFASEFINSEDIVLDIACGVGYGSYLLAKKDQKGSLESISQELR